MVSKTTNSNLADVQKLRSNEKKWSKPLMDAGWTVIPSIIIEKQEALGLDAIDMNIIVHLTQYWWDAENLPHPKVETIAKAIGVKARTVQKRIKALQALNLITRHERKRGNKTNDTNLYSFEGLIDAVRPFAEEKLIEKKAAIEKKQARLERKSRSWSSIMRPHKFGFAA